MGRASESWSVYISSFVNILLVFAAVLAVNGFYFINLDGWRYSGAYLGTPLLSPVMLAVFNYPAYAMFGPWGEMILQLLVFAYVLTRASFIFGFRVNLPIAIAWLFLTLYAFFGNTFVVDPWTPILLLLLLAVGSSRRLNYLDLLLLFVASGAHNIHVLIALAALVVGIAARLVARRRLLIAFTIVATVPFNVGMAHIFHPGVKPLRWTFIASDVLLKYPKVHGEFCLSNVENPLCVDPYLAKIAKGRSEGWNNLLWGANSLFIDSPELAGKPLTIEQAEAASRQFVAYVAIHDPLLFIEKGMRGLGGVLFSNPMYEFSWSEFTNKMVNGPLYAYVAKDVKSINQSLQAENYFIKWRFLAFGKFCVSACYSLFFISFAVCWWRRDWACLRLHAFIIVVVLGVGLSYSIFATMFPRYYFRDLVLLGVPVLSQLARMQPEMTKHRAVLRNYALRLFDANLAKVTHFRTPKDG